MEYDIKTTIAMPQRKKVIIDGQETNYSVTSDGKVFNDKTGRQLKGTVKSNEYLRVQLTINGKPKNHMIHRLVAKAFVENPNGYDLVDHIDRNKLNNDYTNLRWVTASENNKNVDKKQVKRQVQYYQGEFDENWKPIAGHENYMINKDGMVVNPKMRNILKATPRNGYLRVGLGSSKCSVHILVWETFKGEIPEGMVIDHIDGNRSNPKLENLRMITQSENMYNTINTVNENIDVVKCYDKETKKFVKTYNSVKEAATDIGVTPAAIRTAINKGGTCHSMYWIRKDESLEEVLDRWIPEGYKPLPQYPGYCINKDGEVFSKGGGKHLKQWKKASEVETYVMIQGKRENPKELLSQIEF